MQVGSVKLCRSHLCLTELHPCCLAMPRSGGVAKKPEWPPGYPHRCDTGLCERNIWDHLGFLGGFKWLELEQVWISLDVKICKAS